MVRYVVRICLNDLATRFTPQECAEIVRKYPPTVWQEVHRRHNTMDYDISIKMGKDSQGDGQMVINAAQTPMGQQVISPQSFLTAIGLDPATEESQSMQWAAARQPPLGSQPQTQEGPPSPPAPVAPAPAPDAGGE